MAYVGWIGEQTGGIILGNNSNSSNIIISTTAALLDQVTGENGPFYLLGIIFSLGLVVIVSALTEGLFPARSSRMGPKSLSDVKRTDLVQSKGYIAEKWASAASGKTFDVYDPATLDKIATIPEMGKEDTTRAIKAAHEAFKSYKKTTARQRARWLRKWGDLCMEHADDLALILTMENGKTLAEAKGEVTYAASFLEWYAGEAERIHGEVVPVANQNQRVLTFKQPLGVAACLAPWNFPIAMITRKVGAALAAGCTTVWKPAGETPLSALAQAVLAQEAGFPKGAINVITTLNLVGEVGEELCKNKLVRKLSFTGSTRVGKLLAQQCAQSLTKLTLELGGNSPFIVFDDAKLETAVEACILAKFRNSGQTCVTANRIFVQKGIYNKFAEALTKRIKELKVGPGTEEGVFVGPLTHERAVEKAMKHIDGRSRQSNCKLWADTQQTQRNTEGRSFLVESQCLNLQATSCSPQLSKV
jgi:succinate-semialdehyde dehydrogenase/glutarate-semialdehyde dehydrogenase